MGDYYTSQANADTELMEDDEEENMKVNMISNLKKTNRISKKTWSISQKYETILIGDSYCGKTTYLNTLVESERLLNTPVLVSPDQNQYEFWVETESSKAIFIIKDTANQERFRSLTQSHYRKAECVLLAFDLSNEATFFSLEKWYTDALNYSKNRENKMPIVLLGMKKKRSPLADPNSYSSRNTTIDAQLIEKFIDEHPPVIDYCEIDLTRSLTDSLVKESTRNMLKEPFELLLRHFERNKNKVSENEANNTLNVPRSKSAYLFKGKNEKKKTLNDRKLSMQNVNYVRQQQEYNNGRGGGNGFEDLDRITRVRADSRLDSNGKSKFSDTDSINSNETSSKKCCCIS